MQIATVFSRYPCNGYLNIATPPKCQDHPPQPQRARNSQDSSTWSATWNFKVGGQQGNHGRNMTSSIIVGRYRVTWKSRLLQTTMPKFKGVILTHHIPSVSQHQSLKFRHTSKSVIQHHYPPKKITCPLKKGPF